MSALTTRCAVFAAPRGVLVGLVSALLVLLGAGGDKDAAAGPQAPEDATTFSYEQYCDAKGRFTYDGAALKLVQRSAHLQRVYEDAARGDTRAKELVRELEQEFHQVGVVVADTTTRPACLPLPELTLECQPNWQFLTEFLDDTPEAERLRQVVARAYKVRARERGLKNQVIVAGVSLLWAGGLAKGLVTRAQAAEARAAAGQALPAEAQAGQAEARATGKGAIAAGGVGSRFLPLTARNFRENLARRTGGAPAGAQAHHIFPQKFAVQFEQAGINIHDPHFGVWWETSVHQRAASAYNRAWGAFFSRNPNPTAQQLFTFGRELAGQYGLKIAF